MNEKDITEMFEKLTAQISKLEAKIQTIEKPPAVQGIDAISNEIMRLRGETDKPTTDDPYYEAPVAKKVFCGFMLPPLPAGPAVLATDATNGLHWAELDTDYKGGFRTAADTVEGDFARAHS